MAYWLNLFTAETWKEANDAGGNITGFRESRWSRAQRIQPGDVMLCYCVGVYRWVGILSVTGAPTLETPETAERIWEQDFFPVRVPVQVVHKLSPETGVPVQEMLEELEITNRMQNRERWGMQFRGSPAAWSDHDGELVVEAIAEAVANPVTRELPPGARRRAAVTVEVESGEIVTLPDDEDDEDETDLAVGRPESEHTRMQLLLAQMGAAMGYGIWIPMSDRGKTWEGRSLAESIDLLQELRIPLVGHAVRIIREIDVIWIDRDAVQAAFEVEKTTSVYSGILRMTDLLALQPNLAIQCFLVAPDDRRQKVYEQINRPTFARMRRPLHEICSYISFSQMTGAESQGPHAWRHMRFSYLTDEIAESMAPADL